MNVIWHCVKCWQPIEPGAGYVEHDPWHDPPAFSGWRAVHRGCDEMTELASYWWAIERLSTDADLSHAAEHMRGKRWWDGEAWDALLASPMCRRVQSATPDPRTPTTTRR